MKRASATKDKQERQRTRTGEAHERRAEAQTGTDRETDSSDEAAQSREAVTTGDSSDPNKASTSSRSSSPGGEPATSEEDAKPAHGGTFPNPTTFAERVMHILENAIAPNAMWWLQNGEAIAINPEVLSNCGVLASHFHGNRFATFLRTLTRWGFKKVPDHGQPDNIIVLRNSLFQKARPQYVQYMMMDSDVQDVFDEHQRNLAGGAPPAAGMMSEPAASTQASTAAQSDQAEEENESPSPPDTETLQMQANALLQRFSGQQKSQATPATVNLADSSNQEATRATGTASTGAARPAQGSEDPTIVALRGLLQHTEHFLNVSSQSDPQLLPMRTLLQLVLLLGSNHLQIHGQQLQQQRYATDAAAAQQLVQQLGQMAGQQATHHAAQAMPMQALQAMPGVFQYMQQYGVQAQQQAIMPQPQQPLAHPQPPQPQPPMAQQPTLQQAFVQPGTQQAFMSPESFAAILQQSLQQVGQNLQQQQPQQALAMANPENQGMAAGAGVPPGAPMQQVPQLLQVLLQNQQQQQPNPPQQSPPGPQNEGPGCSQS